MHDACQIAEIIKPQWQEWLNGLSFCTDDRNPPLTPPPLRPQEKIFVSAPLKRYFLRHFFLLIQVNSERKLLFLNIFILIVTFLVNKISDAYLKFFEYLRWNSLWQQLRTASHKPTARKNFIVNITGFLDLPQQVLCYEASGNKPLYLLLLLHANGTREAQYEIAIAKWKNPNDYEDNEMCFQTTKYCD